MSKDSSGRSICSRSITRARDSGAARPCLAATGSPSGRDRHHLGRHVGQQDAPSRPDQIGDGQAQSARTTSEFEHVVAGGGRDGIDHRAGDRLGALLDLVGVLGPGRGHSAPHLVHAAAHLVGVWSWCGVCGHDTSPR